MGAELCQAEAVIEAQCVKHEFAGDIGRGELGAGGGEQARSGGHIIMWLALLRIAHYLPVGEADFAVGAGADTQVIAEGPVVEVVAATITRLAVSRHLVLAVVRRRQQLLASVLNIRQGILDWQQRRPFVEDGIGLDRQLVPGQVRRGKTQGGLQIRGGGDGGLLWQAVHQVDIEAVEPGRAGVFDGRPGLVAVVDSPQGLQASIVEALYPQRQAGDAGGPEGCKFPCFGAAGIGLHGDFSRGRQLQQRSYACQQAGDCPG